MMGVLLFIGVMDVFAGLSKGCTKSIRKHESDLPKWVTMKGIAAALLFMTRHCTVVHPVFENIKRELDISSRVLE